jgi:hypothetical protein
MIDQRSGNALPTGRRQHGKIVNVDLAAGLFELRQHITRQRAHRHAAGFRQQADHVGIGKPVQRPIIAGRGIGVAFLILKPGCEHPVHGPETRKVTGPEATNVHAAAQTRTAVPLALTISIDPVSPITS